MRFGWYARATVLLVIAAAGVGSIMATSVAPDVWFTEVNIEGAWRCPGRDVVVRWESSEPAPASLSVSGEDDPVVDTTGEVTLPAAMFDTGYIRRDVSMVLETPGAGYPDTYEIRTFHRPGTVERAACARDDGSFVMPTPSPLWDDRLVVSGVTITSATHKLICGEDTGDPPPVWRVTKGGETVGELDAEHGYAMSVAPPVAVAGEWKFRIPDVRRAELCVGAFDWYERCGMTVEIEVGCGE
jgi:hypothetical protein